MSDLSGKSLGELRAMAKELGINPSGKNAAELAKLIEAKGGAKKSKKTEEAAPKKAVKKAKPEPEEEEEEEAEEEAEEEEEEEEEPEEKPAAKKGKTSALPAEIVEKITKGLDSIDKIAKGVAKYQQTVNGIIAVVVALCKAVGETKLIPKDWKSSSKDEPEETEEEETEEEEEEEEEEEKPKAKKGKPAKKEEVEEEEELTLSPEDLAKMNLTQLKELAEKCNESGMGEEEDNIEFEDVSSPRVLRERIKEWATKYAETEVEEEPKSKKKASKDEEEEEEEEEEAEEEEEEEEQDVPAWVKVGTEVQVNVSEDEDEEVWENGAISEVVAKKKKLVVDMDDGTTVDAPWDFGPDAAIRRVKKGKK